MLAHRRQRLPNIKTTLVQRFVFAKVFFLRLKKTLASHYTLAMSQFGYSIWGTQSGIIMLYELHTVIHGDHIYSSPLI